LDHFKKAGKKKEKKLFKIGTTYFFKTSFKNVKMRLMKILVLIRYLYKKRCDIVKFLKENQG